MAYQHLCDLGFGRQVLQIVTASQGRQDGWDPTRSVEVYHLRADHILGACANLAWLPGNRLLCWAFGCTPKLHARADS